MVDEKFQMKTYEDHISIIDTETGRELNLNDKIYSDKYLLSEISKAKNEMMDVARYTNLYQGDYRLSKGAEVYDLYQRKLKKKEFWIDD